MDNRHPPLSEAYRFQVRTAPTPPWVWLLLIGVLGLIFWHFVPKSEVEVLYYPWFTEQVESGNIASLQIEGSALHGRLRRIQQYVTPNTSTTILVHRFSTHAPSENSIQPIVQTLIENDKKSQGGPDPTLEPTRIDVRPSNSASGLAWILLLLPTFVILLFIYIIMRKVRNQSGGGTLGSSVNSEEEIIARAEAACRHAASLCQVQGVLSDIQKERLERAVSELQKALKDHPQPEV
jgi:cell division protease FtsH